MFLQGWRLAALWDRLSCPSAPRMREQTLSSTRFRKLLQSELEDTGVQVQALCPGLVETEFHERVGADPNRFPSAIVMKPEDVVQASLTGLKLREAICVPPLEDPDLLTQIQEDEKKFFELSRSGILATRYRELKKFLKSI